MASDARERMIDGAAILLALRGLDGTSFGAVLERTGAPRGSIYHHFPDGKDQLVAEAVALTGDRAIAVLDGLVGRSAPEVAEAFLGLWRSVLTRSELRAGCAVLAVTVAAESPALLERSASVFRAWRARLGELLADGGVPAASAAGLAATLIAASEGAVVLSRAERSLEPFDLVAATLLEQVGAAVGLKS